LKVPTEEAKQRVYAFYLKTKEDRKDLNSNWDVFQMLMKMYLMGIDAVSKIELDVPIQRILDEVNCSYLKNDGLNWNCLELVNRTKKKKLLSTERNETLELCKSCKQGKAQAILEQYQKQLRGQNIKGILSMIKQFQAFATSGVPSTIYFCNRIPSRQVITGKKTIHCGKVQMQIVPIDPTCTDPECKYFQEFTIKVEQDFPKEALHLIEGIAEDYKRIEDLTPKQPKEVDAEQGEE
jgi:hypothetical protein